MQGLASSRIKSEKTKSPLRTIKKNPIINKYIYGLDTTDNRGSVVMKTDNLEKASKIFGV